MFLADPLNYTDGAGYAIDRRKIPHYMVLTTAAIQSAIAIAVAGAIVFCGRGGRLLSPEQDTSTPVTLQAHE